MINYNFLCFLTLVKKEVFRFLKVGIQTVIGPAISSLLFFEAPFKSYILISPVIALFVAALLLRLKK